MREKALLACLLAGCPLDVDPLDTITAANGSSGTVGSSDATEPTSAGPTGPTSSTADTTVSSTDATVSSTDATTDTSTTTTTTTTTTSTTEDTTGSTGEPGAVVLVIEGMGEYPVTCEVDDADCGARTACELVSGDVCEKVRYDCKLSGKGSYVPPRFAAMPEDFSFGLYELEAEDDFGNICSCFENVEEATAFLQSLGVGTEHEWCGLGHWYLTFKG